MEHEERLKAALADRYRIEREIGSGGMATVYLAQDLKHDRQVAVKVLRPEVAASLGTERFLAEIRLTARLQHPHIVPLFDSGEADTFLYYVMPYVAGESLRDRLKRERQLAVEDALRIAVEVAEATPAPAVEPTPVVEPTEEVAPMVEEPAASDEAATAAAELNASTKSW